VIIRTGAITATISVQFTVAPPAGSSVSCGLGVASNDALAPTDGQSAQAAVHGSKATCSIVLHYSWRLASANTNMAILYSVSGPVHSSAGTYQVIKVPANGTNTHVAVTVAQ